LFTRHNSKTRAIAKGIKRGTKTRFAAGIDLPDVGEVVISSRHERPSGLATITEWKQTHALSGLREKLFRIRAAEYAAEITAGLTEDWDRHMELFDALVEALASLAEASGPLAAVVEYQIRLLASIGSQPRFDACALCGRADDLTHFSSLEGGMICRHCEPGQIEKREVSPATLHVCRTGRLQSGTPGSLTGAFSTLNYHIAHLMGREVRLAAQLVSTRRRRMVDYPQRTKMEC
jgi:DNA repair protein RecO